MNKIKNLILPIGVVVITILLTIVLCINVNMEDHKFKEDYPQLDENKLIIKYTTANEVLELLANNYSGIIVYGFKQCPWCQAVVPYVNEIALEKGYQEVLYLDIKDMRDNPDSIEKEQYNKIFNLIKGKIGNPEKIFAPTITVLKEGKITSYSTGTVDSHQINENHILPPMTEEQIMELRQLFRKMF